MALITAVMMLSLLAKRHFEEKREKNKHREQNNPQGG
jgi:hypothetical protein